jgi:hypothetical protein
MFPCIIHESKNSLKGHTHTHTHTLFLAHLLIFSSIASWAYTECASQTLVIAVCLKYVISANQQFSKTEILKLMSIKCNGSQEKLKKTHYTGLNVLLMYGFNKCCHQK